MGCDTPPTYKTQPSTSRFNPRTRMGCDDRNSLDYNVDEVSIHAPAWGATVLNPLLVVANVFQSTHPHGVRHNGGSGFEKLIRFQSTHPHGVRPYSRPERWYHTIVSIHAPAWGATTPTEFSYCTIKCFNPRTRMGCDVRRSPASHIADRFQSTHPHGVRLHFNNAIFNQYGFQSTHPHGVRPSKGTIGSITDSFNPRTRMGCDKPFVIFPLFSFGFNPRTRMGCDPLNDSTSEQSECFNPRTRMGCDTGRSRSIAVGFGFNPRTRMGCDRK